MKMFSLRVAHPINKNHEIIINNKRMTEKISSQKINQYLFYLINININYTNYVVNYTHYQIDFTPQYPFNMRK